MITEVLLILPLYLIWFFIWYQFRCLIKIMADVENTLNDDDFFGNIVDTSKKHPHKKEFQCGFIQFCAWCIKNDEFFGDTVDTPKEGIEQHRKRERLKSVIGSGKTYLLGYKQTQEKVDKASNETINITYALYKQRELNGKGEKIGKVLGKHFINLYSGGISRVLKIRNVTKLRQDTENDPIIKEQMANLGCLLVCAFGNFLVPILMAAHTVNNLDLDNKLEDEGYESD